jgi:hypothetical protein
VPLDAPLERRRVYHVAVQHDRWCTFYSGGLSNCAPIINRFVEPVRQ